MQNHFFYKILVMTLVLACMGCDKAASPEINMKPAVAQLQLSEFPSASRMLLGEFQAQFKPLITLPVVAPADGKIRFHIAKPRQMLSQDTLWAEVSPEQIAVEEREMELNTRNEKLRLREELHNLLLELERVEFMLNDPALRELPYAAKVPVSTRLVQQLREKRQLLEERLQVCGEVERLAFEQKSLRSRLRMPFDGELLVSLPVSEQRNEFRVASSTPIGIIRDVSELYLHIVIRDPQIITISPEHLYVEFKRETGKVFQGRFHDTQVTELQKQDVLIYRFAFSPDDIDELAALIGANLTCELWVNATREFHTVPKFEVARGLGGQGSFSGWHEAVKKLWPTAEMLYCGRTKLGIATEANPK